jgi:hypothetical protein
MRVAKPKTVTVRIYGPHGGGQEDFPSTGSGNLKVVTSMLVTLTEPDNPAAFKISDDPHHTGTEFLPFDNFAEWDWTVTPDEGGDEPKKLRVTAFMVFHGKLPNGTPITREVSSYEADIQVDVKPRLEVIGDWFSENWKDVLKYTLPSGALSLVVVFLIRKKWGTQKEAESEDDDEE